METIKKFNKIRNYENLSVRSLHTLKEGSTFPISKIRFVKTKKYENKIIDLNNMPEISVNKVVVDLIDSDHNWEEFQVYLPYRFSEKLTEKDLKAMNEIEDLVFVYKGVGNNKKITSHRVQNRCRS